SPFSPPTRPEQCIPIGLFLRRRPARQAEIRVFPGRLVTSRTAPIIPRFLFGPIEGADGGEAGCDHHGKPVRLADHEACRRYAGRARRRLRAVDRVGASDAGPAVQVRKIRAQAGLQGGDRGCGRGRSPARHDRLAHVAAGIRRPDEYPRPRRQGQSPVDPADAGRHSRGHARDRQARRDQCRAARRRRSGALRFPARQAARPMARPPDRSRRRTPEGLESHVLSPDSTIGILGGGQLGRMLALAAARLGFKCHVLAPSPDSPAFDVVHRVTCADYNDTEALDRFAADVDVVTYEFENVPADTATFLSARVPVLPDPKILATTQDRLAEKNFVAGLGIRTAPYAAVGAPSELTAALDRIGRPAVLKTRRFGYDGKG